MGAELARNFPVAQATFDEADDALGFKLSQMCFQGPEDQLRLTTNTQPAIVATSIAALRVFQAEIGAQPEVAAGHSLGEYSALVSAGALAFPDALRAVRERGRLMQEACPEGKGAMAALIGLEPDAVAEICAQVSTGSEAAVAANLNAPGQIVIAGHAGPVRRAIELAKERGATMSQELKVSAPFHCPLMEPAREGMKPILERIAVSPLKFGVIANVTAAVNRDAARVTPLLIDQITSPVRWEESMKAMAAMGVTDAVEFGGRVLMGLMRRIDRNVKVKALEDITSLKAVKELFAGA
jgi:[acyl-carrier-protein] S-malonyltransferase